jgi:hypothetical protein
MDVLSAFGVSAAAGLNAYLPLLIVGLLARYTDLITLNSPWNALESPWVLGVLVILLIIEMTVDKIAIADSVNDILQTVVRPAAGAILFAASGNLIANTSPVLAMALGIVAAGSIHAVKATARPFVTATTGGLGNPVISVIEDVASITLTLLAILVPILTVVLLLIAVWLVLRWVRRRRAAAPSA